MDKDRPEGREEGKAIAGNHLPAFPPVFRILVQ
jgi:hypothetical protein